MSESSDKMKHSLIVFLSVIGILSLLFGLGAVFSKFLEVQDTSPKELMGSLWRAEVDEDPVLYLLTKKVIHELRVSKYLPWETVTFRRYTLQSRNSRDGSIRAEVVLGDRYQREGGSEMLGIAGNHLWLWNEQLEIRDLKTLELLADTESLRSTNPSFAEVLPNDPKFFRVSARLDTLIFKSLDARYFTVSAPEGKVSWLNDEDMKATGRDCHQGRMKYQLRPCGTVWHGKAKFLFQMAESEGKGLWGTTYNDYIHQSLREKKAWYALLSLEEKSKLMESDLNHQSRPYGDDARMFYRVPYRHNAKRNEWELNLDQVQAINQTRFIKGGLLKRRSVVERAEHSRQPDLPPLVNVVGRGTEYTWRLDSPSSVLVLSKPTLEENSPWQLTRMSLEGQVVWSVSTSLVIIREILPGDHYIVIGGFEDAQGAQGRIPMRLTTIDVGDGRLRMSTVESPQEP